MVTRIVPASARGYGSLVSASSVSVRPGVFCQGAQAIVLPHPRKCAVVSHHLMVYIGNVRYLKGPRLGADIMDGNIAEFFHTSETHPTLVEAYMARTTI